MKRQRHLSVNKEAQVASYLVPRLPLSATSHALQQSCCPRACQRLVGTMTGSICYFGSACDRLAAFRRSCLRPSAASILVHGHSAGVEACCASSAAAVAAAADLGETVQRLLGSAGKGSCAVPAGPAAEDAGPAETSHSAAAAGAAMAGWLEAQPQGGSLGSLGIQHLHATQMKLDSVPEAARYA